MTVVVSVLHEQDLAAAPEVKRFRVTRKAHPVKHSCSEPESGLPTPKRWKWLGSVRLMDEDEMAFFFALVLVDTRCARRLESAFAGKGVVLIIVLHQLHASARRTDACTYNGLHHSSLLSPFPTLHPPLPSVHHQEGEPTCVLQS